MSYCKFFAMIIKLWSYGLDSSSKTFFDIIIKFRLPDFQISVHISVYSNFWLLKKSINNYKENNISFVRTTYCLCQVSVLYRFCPCHALFHFVVRCHRCPPVKFPVCVTYWVTLPNTCVTGFLCSQPSSQPFGYLHCCTLTGMNQCVAYKLEHNAASWKSPLSLHVTFSSLLLCILVGFSCFC